MMTNDEIIQVVTAHNEGKKIQFRHRNESLWCDVDVYTPIWDFTKLDYRVAPEPRKPREWNVLISTNGDFIDSPRTGQEQLQWFCRTIRVREVLE